jgi:hypothetical protein
MWIGRETYGAERRTFSSSRMLRHRLALVGLPERLSCSCPGFGVPLVRVIAKAGVLQFVEVAMIEVHMATQWYMYFGTHDGK